MPYALPQLAVPQVLDRFGRGIEDIDQCELHEAFAVLRVVVTMCVGGGMGATGLFEVR